MDNLKGTYQEILTVGSRYTRLVESLEPYKRRFHAEVLIKNHSFHGTTDDIVTSDGEFFVDAEGFTLSFNPALGDSTQGFVYEAEGYLKTTKHFTLPYAYVEDPDAWEKEHLLG